MKKRRIDEYKREYEQRNHDKKRRKRRNQRKHIMIIAMSMILCLTVLLVGLKCSAENSLWELAALEMVSDTRTITIESQTQATVTATIDETMDQSCSEIFDEFKTQLEERVSQEEGTWSIYLKDLSTGEELSINNVQMYAASLIKLFVMRSCYEHWDQIVENDSAYSGSELDSSEKVMTLLTNMITVSDNESYNELVRMHSSTRSFTDGCLFIEDYLCSDTAYINTGIFHTLSPSSTESERTEETKNYTCVEDCGLLLESIYEGSCVSTEASREMLDLLLQQTVTDKILSGLPEGISVANKTGETDEVQHDAAIVFGEKTDYILCVMSSDISGAGDAQSVIQDISGMVYELLNG